MLYLPCMHCTFWSAIPTFVMFCLMYSSVLVYICQFPIATNNMLSLVPNKRRLCDCCSYLGFFCFFLLFVEFGLEVPALHVLKMGCENNCVTVVAQRAHFLYRGLGSIFIKFRIIKSFCCTVCFTLRL